MGSLKIKYFCPWWGLDHLDLEDMLVKIKTGGYDGVEIGIPFVDKEQERLKKLLNKYELELIAHQYQAEGSTVEEYLKSYKRSLKNAAAFKPFLINSHTGKDYWSVEDNIALVKASEEISEEYGVNIVHETHRGRFLYSAPVAKQYFDHLPDLKINADFSHWVCVSESLLEDQQDTVQEAISRAEHIHARVGFSQGPQISDPKAPEWENEVQVFTSWWERIVAKHTAENRSFLTITPEFGPPPYMWRLPFTNQPINDQWDLNIYMMNYLKDHFDKTH